jgi:peptidoglycan/LPS O-acetylase OafA/YrhL
MSTVRTGPAADFNTALNGYRGLCALLVFVYHCGSAGVVQWPEGSLLANSGSWLWSACRYGVEMFFMISGFVILGSLLRHATVQGFLWDRVVRIFSAWIPTLLVVTAVCILFGLRYFVEASPLEAVGMVLANLLLLPPFVPVPMIHPVSWSLSYEWVFYLTAAGALLSIRRDSRSSWVVALWVMWAALFIGLFPRALFFVTGVLVFKYRDWFAARRGWLRGPLLSLLVFLIAWRCTEADEAALSLTFVDFIRNGSWVAALIAFIAALHMFAGVCLNASRQTAWLNGRTFQFLGAISYSFYLWHSLVMSFTKRAVNAYVTPELGLAAGFSVFVISSLVIALPVSWVSWRVFEVRLAAVLRRMVQRRPVITGAVGVH